MVFKIQISNFLKCVKCVVTYLFIVIEQTRDQIRGLSYLVFTSVVNFCQGIPQEFLKCQFDLRIFMIIQFSQIILVCDTFLKFFDGNNIGIPEPTEYLVDSLVMLVIIY